ncbi:NAD(P)-dependent oxidoreductase [Paenibacillus sp. SYP-B3998]|uniref:NAD(P)-dependent oxidoreductase n=1 Tax=Paenibacillus sp. SYP-B3998 TaxID=2678564 RepID=A0A6G3ZS95_9BACL|nr:NAD(P)-dependent oxidoreductase [Paenibacillus sp. SYP-B3998]NEW04908.1 NAD(P)-dependent oxidoreductase [Paenibacillus sp. SYP-B3998]
MKILVTGATGVIGRLLLPLLVKEGHEVIGMTHNPLLTSQIRTLGASAVLVDALDRDAVAASLREARPEVVIHQLTSLSTLNVADNAKIRTVGTRNLVDAAQAAGVRRMIAQSISWAYEPGSEPAREEASLDTEAPLPRKTTIDGVIALERAVAELPEHVILRYGQLYGQGTWYDHNGLFEGKVRQQQVPATEGVSSFLHVHDAAQAALKALHWPNGSVNIVDDEPAQGKVWLPFYASVIGAPAPKIEDVSNRGERGASNAKARNTYGWEPAYPSWREGFKGSLSE